VLPRRFLLYGATGFSGTLVATLARQRGMAPIVAGRDPGRVRRLAAQLGCEHRVISLDQPEQLAAALHDVHVVLNAAGPFTATAAPIVDACLRTSTHYLDVAGEVPVLDAISRRDATARTTGVMLMPAVGFVVVPSDCLAAYVTRKLPGARRLAIAVSRTDVLSRGSAKTILEQWSDVVTVRRAGVLTSVPIGQRERHFDYGRGPRQSAAVSWGDVVSAYHTTGIPDVEAYLEVSPAERAMFRLGPRLTPLLDTTPLRRLLRFQAELLSEAPSARHRASAGRVVVAEVRDASGQCARARLRTPEAYGFTAASALAIVERVLHGDFEAGFQTPARVYGADFVLGLEGVVREDLPA
jgi:short subunit dehydrogenase-like uncharacterized protein